MKTITARLLLALTLAGATATGFADSGNDPEGSGITVRFNDLELSKPQDAAVLYKRIQRAARMVCNDSSSSWDAAVVRNRKRCFESTVDAAVAKIDRPVLTAMHRSKTRGPAMG